MNSVDQWIHYLIYEMSENIETLNIDRKPYLQWYKQKNAANLNVWEAETSFIFSHFSITFKNILVQNKQLHPCEESSQVYMKRGGGAIVRGD